MPDAMMATTPITCATGPVAESIRVVRGVSHGMPDPEAHAREGKRTSMTKEIDFFKQITS